MGKGLHFGLSLHFGHKDQGISLQNFKLYTLYKRETSFNWCANCTFCQEAVESVEHLLFSCRISSEFWKHVLSWLRDNDVHVEAINESDVIFGKFDIVDDYILINHILRIGKYYIYYRKCQNSVPSIRGFITRARRVFNIELHIAREKNILLFHFQKWEKLTNALNSSYNSFKIFPRFWLAKSTRIIHHNQRTDDQIWKNFAVNEPITSKVQPSSTDNTLLDLRNSS